MRKSGGIYAVAPTGASASSRQKELICWDSRRQPLRLHHPRECHDKADFDRSGHRRGQCGHWRGRGFRAHAGRHRARPEQGRSGSAQHHAGSARLAGDIGCRRHACRQPVVAARSAHAIGPRACRSAPPDRGPLRAAGFFVGDEIAAGAELQRQQCRHRHHHRPGQVTAAAGGDLDVAAAAFAVSCGEIAWVCRGLAGAAPCDQDAVRHRRPARRPAQGRDRGRRHVVDRGPAQPRRQDRKSRRALCRGVSHGGT